MTPHRLLVSLRQNALMGLLAAATVTLSAEPVVVPAGVDHTPWDGLLQTYVDANGLVDYAGWHASEPDVAALHEYLGQFTEKPDTEAAGLEASVTQINLYNALTIQWMLANYPTESIMDLPNSFKERRHPVGGRLVSLDEVEHDTIRPVLGHTTHAVLVCAALDCPPLQQRAFTVENWSALSEKAYREWLGNEDLNRYDLRRQRVYLSKLFEWFKKDFVAAGGIAKVLATYGPERFRAFLASGEYEVNYIDYDWTINEQGRSR